MSDVTLLTLASSGLGAELAPLVRAGRAIPNALYDRALAGKTADKKPLTDART